MNRLEPRFLTEELVLWMHHISIRDQGGDPAARNLGLLRSALAIPMQQFDGEW